MTNFKVAEVIAKEQANGAKLYRVADVVKLLSLVTLIFFQVPAQSKEYVGVNLCGKVNVQTLTDFYKKSGARVIVEDENSELKTQEIEVRGYVIADAPRTININIFEGKGLDIQVTPAEGLVPILDAKYGTPKLRRESFGTFISESFEYKIKDDPGVTLLLYFKEPSSIYYGCLALKRQKSNRATQLENKKVLQKPGAKGL